MAPKLHDPLRPRVQLLLAATVRRFRLLLAENETLAAPDVGELRQQRLVRFAESDAVEPNTAERVHAARVLDEPVVVHVGTRIPQARRTLGLDAGLAVLDDPALAVVLVLDLEVV